MIELALRNCYRLRLAREYFSAPTEQLDTAQQQWIEQTVERQLRLEECILASNEAREQSVDRQEIERSAQDLQPDYQRSAGFSADLMAYGINVEQWLAMLERQLLVEKVLAKVADSAGKVDESEVRSWYERYPNKFIRPEQRLAFHLFITINDDFPENRRDAVIEKIEKLRMQLRRQPDRFGEFAQANSECPTALKQGEIGWVSSGSLIPELDAVLFKLQENELSQPIESQMGFHLLFCQGIRQKVTMSYPEVAVTIRENLQKKRIKQHQKKWMSKLV